MLVAASRVANTKGIDMFYPVQELRAFEVNLKASKFEIYIDSLSARSSFQNFNCHKQGKTCS